MVITTIKMDGKGNPVRVKYRIVALGNMDPHPWTKQGCFVPVLSHMELQLLTSIAVKLGVIPKRGGVLRHLIRANYQMMKLTFVDHQLGVQSLQNIATENC
mmetsp:Transcript_15539/g.22155  ORF Transcript_15539/g.22155 Transcript_15539/m.22155 type:complete len:101 (-) Transcript_15539:1087-1389(-)